MDSILILIGVVILIVWFERKNAAASSAAGGTSTALPTVPAPIAQAKNTPTQTVPPGTTATATRTALPAAGVFSNGSPEFAQVTLPSGQQVTVTNPPGLTYRGLQRSTYGIATVATKDQAIAQAQRAGYLAPFTVTGTPGAWVVVGYIAIFQ